MEVFELNQVIDQQLKDNALDFATILNTHLNGKISMVAASNSSDWIGLDEQLQVIPLPNESNSYYGVSPKIDNECIITAISNFSLRNLESVTTFLKAHHMEFMLHKGQERYMIAFFKYIILQYAKNFGIRLYLTDGTLKTALQQSDFQHIVTIDGNVVTVKGCPIDALIYLLDKYTFKYNDQTHFWEIDYSVDAISFDGIYAQKENIVLLNGVVFYSGVLLRPKAISQFHNLYENNNVIHYRLIFERSVFATVFALDQALYNHPLMAEDLPEIVKFIEHDDKVKMTLMWQIRQQNTQKNPLEEVNAYLANTYGVNQIGVAANVVTRDGKLILSQRSQASIDEKMLYAGANGNAEVYDPDVSFYQNSVYEDYPTITLGTHRSDFVGEIVRETKAELSLITQNSDWDCVGLVLMGNTPVEGESSEPKSRRMHFSLIFETYTSYTFDEVIQMGQHATESFENDKLLGLTVHTYRTKKEQVYRTLMMVLEKIFESKDFLEVLMLIFMTILNADAQLLFGDNWFMTVFNSIVLILIVVKISNWIKAHQKNKRNRLNMTIIYGEQSELLKQALLKETPHYEFHPVALMSCYVYIMRKINF